MALGDQLLTQVSIVGDDPVVHHGEVRPAARVGVSIGLGHGAMRRPARVRDADRPLDSGEGNAAIHFLDGADVFAHDQTMAVHDGDAARVIAAVLEIANALEQGARDRMLADDSTDPAHFGDTSRPRETVQFPYQARRRQVVR